jgi:hypothetical protein
MNIYNILNWKTISVFGKSTVINKSYIYLFLVPALAKILSRINSPLIFFLGNTKYEIVLELPFSWKLFFFSALLFSLGALFYNLFAPTIIKENNSFGEFLTDKKNFSHLFNYKDNVGLTSQWIEKLGLKPKEMQEFNYVKNIPDDFMPYKSIRKSQKEVNKIYLYNLIYQGNSPYNGSEKPRQLETAFWDLLEYANTSKPTLILFTSFFYITGFILITIVFIQSIMLVLNI